jgi:hypothetical protein
VPSKRVLSSVRAQSHRAKDCWTVDSLHRGCGNRALSRLVDAALVCSLNLFWGSTLALAHYVSFCSCAFANSARSFSFSITRSSIRFSKVARKQIGKFPCVDLFERIRAHQ